MKNFLTLIFLGLFLTTQTGLAQDAQKSSTEKVLWDAWYTVTAAGDVPYGFYNDRASIRDGKLHYRNRYWKSEEGYINEENVGVIAEPGADLTPVFFNFRSLYRAAETSIDGSAGQGRALSIRVKLNGKPKPPLQIVAPKGVLLSVLFPVWAGQHLTEIKNGKSASFLTLFENAYEENFPVVAGTMHSAPEDDFSRNSRTQKVRVSYANRNTFWYLEPSGLPVRILYPDQGMRAEKTTESKARAFLGK